MRVVYRDTIGAATTIDGQELPDDRERQRPAEKRAAKSVRVTRINGQRIRFADLASMAFPVKTEANLAFIARVDPRTARRWLADNTEPPAEVLGIILCEIMRRFHQRD